MPSRKINNNGIDAISEALGSLDAKTDSLKEGQQEINRKVDMIESHLSAINGSIIRYNEKADKCNARFKTNEDKIEDLKQEQKGLTLSYKVLTSLGAIMIAVSVFITYILQKMGLM